MRFVMAEQWKELGGAKHKSLEPMRITHRFLTPAQDEFYYGEGGEGHKAPVRIADDYQEGERYVAPCVGCGQIEDHADGCFDGQSR